MAQEKRGCKDIDEQLCQVWVKDLLISVNDIRETLRGRDSVASEWQTYNVTWYLSLIKSCSDSIANTLELLQCCP